MRLRSVFEVDQSPTGNPPRILEPVLFEGLDEQPNLGINSPLFHPLELAQHSQNHGHDGHYRHPPPHRESQAGELHGRGLWKGSLINHFLQSVALSLAVLPDHDHEQEVGWEQDHGRHDEPVDEEEAAPYPHGQGDEYADEDDREEEFREAELRRLHSQSLRPECPSFYRRGFAHFGRGRPRTAAPGFIPRSAPRSQEDGVADCT